MTVMRLCPLNVWNGVGLALDKQAVRLHAWIWRCYSCLSDAVRCRNLTLLRFPNTLERRWRLYVYVRCLNVWNGVVLALAGRTGGAFVLVCLNLLEAVLIGVQYSMKFWVSPWCAVQIHYKWLTNGNDGSAIMFIECMACLLALDEQHVRLHCFLLEFEAVFGQ